MNKNTGLFHGIDPTLTLISKILVIGFVVVCGVLADKAGALFTDMSGDILHRFKWFYLAMIVIGCMVTLDVVFNFMIGMYGVMAIPTMISAFLLAPKVKQAAITYFAKLPKNNSQLADQVR